jgi:hypothetical protein
VRRHLVIELAHAESKLRPVLLKRLFLSLQTLDLKPAALQRAKTVAQLFNA